MTSAGRTFAVTPKSTCQTSPRSGTPRFLLVQRVKGSCSKGGKIVVGQVVGHGRVLDDMATELDPLRKREMLYFVDDVGNG